MIDFSDELYVNGRWTIVVKLITIFGHVFYISDKKGRQRGGGLRWQGGRGA